MRSYGVPPISMLLLLQTQLLFSCIIVKGHKSFKVRIVRSLSFCRLDARVPETHVVEELVLEVLEQHRSAGFERPKDDIRAAVVSNSKSNRQRVSKRTKQQ
jgi:hypothetical protein